MMVAGSKRVAWNVPASMTTLADIEKFVVEKTLARTGGNKASAARLLGIYRHRLYYKIDKYRIDLREIDRRK